MSWELLKNGFKKFEQEEKIRKNSLMRGRCVGKRSFIYMEGFYYSYTLNRRNYWVENTKIQERAKKIMGSRG